jgi:hypothetical protein
MKTSRLLYIRGALRDLFIGEARETKGCTPGAARRRPSRMPVLLRPELDTQLIRVGT